jgi:hypothetical protein
MLDKIFLDKFTESGIFWYFYSKRLQPPHGAGRGLQPSPKRFHSRTITLRSRLLCASKND